MIQILGFELRPTWMSTHVARRQELEVEDYGSHALGVLFPL
jgi:hypothetical protein